MPACISISARSSQQHADKFTLLQNALHASPCFAVLQALQAIEHRENAQAQTISEETLTEWPPGAKFVPEDYDVMASNAAVKQRHLASIMKLGCHWLYSDGPAAAAFFAARTAGTAAKQLMGPKLQPAMPCIPRVGLSETNDQMAFKQLHAVQDKNEYLV